MVLKSSIFSGLSLFASAVFGIANPRACSGACNNAHDPAIIRRSDGTYFRFSTGGKVAIHTAPSIEGPWTFKGAALPDGSKINLPGNQDLWAPDITKIGDLYYLYYSVSAFGSQDSAIGLARSSTMDAGSWYDIGATGIRSDSSKNYNAIDPNLINVNGEYYMTFGSWWSDIHVIKMKSTPTAIDNGASTKQVAFDSVDTAIEGANMFKNGNYYYLFFSKGLCCGYDTTRPAKNKEYKVHVCRSTSPTSGFVDKSGKSCTSGGGTVILESHDWVYGAGGQGVYQDPTHGPIIYYHYVDTRIGFGDGQKKFGWNTLNFSSGWPVLA